jgi:RHS repeat-associated protein
VIKTGSTSIINGPNGLPEEQVTSGGTRYYYHQDQIGSTLALSDSTGTQVQSYAYDPYGNLNSSSGSIANPFQFQGQYLDATSGLYYLRARFYDPDSGAFVRRDLLIGVSRRAYVYANDSPMNGADPSGLLCAGVQGGASGMGGNWSSGGIAGTSIGSVGFCTNGDLFVASTVGSASGCHHAQGIFGGLGLGVFGSQNAQRAQDIGGPFNQTTLGTGAGAGFDITSASGGGVDMASASLQGDSFGAGFANYETSTDVGQWNWVQSLVNDPLVAAASAISNAWGWL